MTDGDCADPAQTARLRCWEIAAEAVRTGQAAPEQLLKMLTVEVGHTDSDVVYTENSLALHRYEPEELRHETPILIVYALVNRPYILDLQPDRSVIRRLLDAGFRVYLIDWGEPSRLDAHLGLADYVERYLDNCVAATLDDAGEAVDELHVLGYCMGGTMSLAYATRDQDPIRTLTCMATPVAFDGTGGILERWAEGFEPGTAVDALGNIPGDVLAVEFSMMDPVEHYVTKYVRLYENLEDDDFVENFARMERWIWDGVDVAGRAFREFVDDLYRENRLVEGTFELDGDPVDLGEISVPLCQIVGEYDHIVPPESSRPLGDLVASDDRRRIEFPAGHIGISVSSSAHADLWPEVTDWLAARSDPVAEGADPDRSDLSGSDEVTAATVDDRERARLAVAAMRRRATASMADDAGTDPAAGPADDGPADGAVERRIDDVARRAVEQLSDAGDAARGDAAPSTPADGEASVETVDGIGSTYADRLAAAGVETVADLYTTDAETLVAVADAPRGRVETWLERATRGTGRS